MIDVAGVLKISDAPAVGDSAVLDEEEYRKLKNFSHGNHHTNEAKKALFKRVRGFLSYHEWCVKNQGALRAIGVPLSIGCTEKKGILKPDAFITQFHFLYHSQPELRDSLLVGLAKAYVAKMSGLMKPQYAEKLIDFCQVMRLRSKAAYEILQANLLTVSVRQLQRIGSADRRTLTTAIDLDRESIIQRCKEWVSSVKGESETLVVSLAIDATKVPKRLEVNATYQIRVSKISPYHAEKLSEGMSVKNVDVKELASESTNELSDFNEYIVDIVTSLDDVRLVSVSCDGLASESDFIRGKLLDFLQSKSSTLGLMDMNHVAKALRSQLVLGSSLITAGANIVDPGLLLEAGIAKALVQVTDYTSDALVLRLGSLQFMDKL
ncbi:hypothetical protein PsorP6_003978 [Peronosclerospora sorghi]|uniref:Uncharacterized protein n=1 Tax=Peronosclerospora sorghi TaxID=230839 RepID=A0ACC0VK77_9STRA|nr:hypothetical protein PsorP6_003978 [Peronosclerospora sorghi]